MQLLYIYLAMLPVLVVGDILWVGYIADAFYTREVGHLRGSIQWVGALLFWLMYTAGILLFVVNPYSADIVKTIFFGACFGLVAYGVYNFTNHATLKDWSLTLVTIDIIWGVFLTSTVSTVGYIVAKKFGL